MHDLSSSINIFCIYYELQIIFKILKKRNTLAYPEMVYFFKI